MALPVVAPSGKLVGVVNQDTVLNVVERESGEDFLKFSGIARGEEFRDMPMLKRVWRRLSWLSINVFLNVIAASVIAIFEDTLRAVIAIVVFLPIISDMSGCSGNQAVAVSIRELALGKIDPRKIRWVIAKEVFVGLLNGLILGVQIGLIAAFWRGIPMLGVVVAMALWLNTILSVIVGGSIPLLLKRFGFDPAMASGPILTTITDMCGFLLVLSLATLFLPYLT
jgi:magnesium transporter